MMFLQFFIWGAWYVTAPNFLSTIGFTAKDFGWTYSVGPDRRHDLALLRGHDRGPFLRGAAGAGCAAHSRRRHSAVGHNPDGRRRPGPGLDQPDVFRLYADLFPDAGADQHPGDAQHAESTEGIPRHSGARDHRLDRRRPRADPGGMGPDHRHVLPRPARVPGAGLVQFLPAPHAAPRDRTGVRSSNPRPGRLGAAQGPFLPDVHRRLDADLHPACLLLSDRQPGGGDVRPAHRPDDVLRTDVGNLLHAGHALLLLHDSA